MIENRPFLTFFSHLILVIGVAIVALPVYVTFVASSLQVDEVLQSPMPMLPGSHLIENYTKALSQGASTNVTTARIDGAGAMRFFWDVVVPLSRPSIAALFLILFIFGWNQYLWPLLVTTDESMYTTVIGIKRMIAGGEAATEWNLVMATAMLAML